MNKSVVKIRAIAAVSTLVAAALLVLLLLFSHLGGVDPALAQNRDSLPKEPEEIFIDAELEEASLDLPEPENNVSQEEAAAPLGEPEKGPEENNSIKVADPKLPKEPVKQPKTVTQTKDSEVKVKNTANNDKENKQVTSKVGNAFTPHNGKTDGKIGGTGTGSVGLGVSGLSGRKRLNDPSFKPVLDKAVTIKVRVTVNEKGNVISAKYVSESGAGAGNQTLRNQCLAAAKKIKWSPKEGAPEETGILTFRLSPPK